MIIEQQLSSGGVKKWFETKDNGEAKEAKEDKKIKETKETKEVLSSQGATMIFWQRSEDNNTRVGSQCSGTDLDNDKMMIIPIWSGHDLQRSKDNNNDVKAADDMLANDDYEIQLKN